MDVTDTTDRGASASANVRPRLPRAVLTVLITHTHVRERASARVKNT